LHKAITDPLIKGNYSSRVTSEQVIRECINLIQM
jgi:hypothetical protein